MKKDDSNLDTTDGEMKRVEEIGPVEISNNGQKLNAHAEGSSVMFGGSNDALPVKPGM